MLKNCKGDLLDALPRAIAFGRTRRGKLSPRYTHGVGPQKIENENTCRTANAMSVSPPRRLRAVSWSAGVPVLARVKCPTRPAMMAQVASMTEPVRRELRRPQVSMRYSAGTVPTTDTPPRIAWMEYGSRLPCCQYRDLRTSERRLVLGSSTLEERVAIVVCSVSC